MAEQLHISSTFDSGAIEVVAADRADDIRLAIRADSHAEFRQWFHFRLQGARGARCRVRFVNASACTYVDGWRDYRVVASYDRQRWFRVNTAFDGAEMTVDHTPERDSVYYAYFEPYTWERHLQLIGRAEDSPLARVRRLGATIEGRDLDVVTVGEPGAGKRSLWVIARQHPGETMAEWFVEGLLERLLDPADSVARTLLAHAVLRVVPNMNPDGSVRGNLRTNAAGANLNREWMTPSEERSPEVFHVRAAMHASGVDALLDVHGDEALPYVFVDGCERLANFTPKQDALQRAFGTALRRASPDFQQVQGYSDDKETKVNLTLASKYAGHAFGCLALTVEMPFKDNADLPDATVGWNGERSKRLGAAALEAFLSVVSEL
jgi:murein tripeptide amidase MpaA